MAGGHVLHMQYGSWSGIHSAKGTFRAMADSFIGMAMSAISQLATTCNKTTHLSVSHLTPVMSESSYTQPPTTTP